MMKIVKSEAGISKLTLLVFGSIIGTIGYVTWEILPFYYYYYEIQNQFESMVRIAPTEKESDIRNKLWYHIRKAGIPVKPQDLHISHSGNNIRISLRYKEVFVVEWDGKEYYRREFPFHAFAEGRL